MPPENQNPNREEGPGRNPGQEHFEQEIEHGFKPQSQTEAQQAVNNQEKSAVSDAETTTKNVTNKNVKTLEETPGEIPYSQTSKKTQQKVSFFGRRRNQALMGGGIFGLILSLTLFGTYSSILQFPHFAFNRNPTAKVQRGAISKRIEKIYKKYFEDKKGSGINDAEIAALEEAGVLKNDGVIKDDALGIKFIDHFSTPDEKGLESKITAANFDQAYTNNIDFKQKVTTFNVPEAVLARSPDTLTRFVGDYHIKFAFPLGESDDQKTIKEQFRKTQYGEPGDARFKTGTEEDQLAADENAKAVKDGPTPEFDKTNTDLNKNVADAVTGAGEKIKALGPKAAQGIFAIYGTECQIYAGVRKEKIAEAVIAHPKLIKFAFSFFTDLDAVRAGHGKWGHLQFWLNFALKPSTDPASKGKNITSSPLIPHLLENKYPNSEDLARFNSSPRLSVARTTLNFLHRAGANRTACKLVLSTPGQIVLAAAGLALAFASGGTASVIGVLGDIGLAAALGYLADFVIHKIFLMLAGTVAPDYNDPGGGFAMGQALDVGLSYAIADQGRSAGLRPLTQQQFAETALYLEPEIASLDAMDHLHKNPFSFSEPDSITNKIALNLAPYVFSPLNSSSMQNLASLLTSPFKLVASSSGSLLLHQAHAATVDQFHGELCDDPDIKALNIVADANCAPVYGLSVDELNKESGDTKQFIENNNHAEPNGTPKSDDYKNYVSTCPKGDIPYLAEGGGIEIDDDTDTRMCLKDDPDKLNNFRVYHVDNDIKRAAQLDLQNKLGTTMDNALQ